MICGAHMYKLLFQIFPTIHRTVAVDVSFDLCYDLCFSIRRVHLIKVLWTVQCACVYFVHSACIQWQNMVSMTVSNVAIKSVSCGIPPSNHVQMLLLFSCESFGKINVIPYKQTYSCGMSLLCVQAESYSINGAPL